MPNRISQVSLNLPFGLGGVTVDVSQAEREAAWKLYVEFGTRISTHPLAQGAGSVREALSSLHALFEITRDILKEAGPEVGQSGDDLGPVAMRVLNDGLRPFLTKWHVAYGDFELAAGLALMKEHGLRGIPIDQADQSQWADVKAFYEELETTRKEMVTFVHQLAMVSGTEPPS